MSSLSVNRQSGAAFLEIVIAIGVLAMLLGAITSLVVASYDVLGYSRTRITARHLANEKIETLRNLPYADVAVVGGIPPGNIPAEESVTRNGLNYNVRTSVVFIDDPFDGLAPTDTLATDYKRVRVDVSWGGTFASNATITLVTDIAPRGIESTGVGGTLSILVFDAQAQPVSDAQVRIQNSIVAPPIDLTVNSDSDGVAVFPGSPVCFECYHIEVTKQGYSSDRTYFSSEVANPKKPLATIVDQQTTNISFAIDFTSSLTVASTQSRDNNFAPLNSQFFQLTGAKTIGTNTQAEPVYKYDQLLQTDGTAQLVINDLEWDVYTLTIPASGWDLGGSNPLSPFVLLPNSSQSLSFASVAQADNSLLFKVLEASGSAISTAAIRLTQTGGFNEALLTGSASDPDFGQAFFTSLSAGDYDVEATKSGYLTITLQTIASGTLIEEITLNRE